MGLTKKEIKQIQSLKEKKHRNKEGLFIAEGEKLVTELCETCQCRWLIATPEQLTELETLHAEARIEATTQEIKQLSSLKSPTSVLALFYQPLCEELPEEVTSSLCLVLDGIQDPGNLGAIVRIADWFGIEQIFCSLDSADLYNPKTVQATMGALARVKLFYRDLATVFARYHEMPVYGTTLDGTSIYDHPLSATGFIVMGNEGNGIRPEIRAYLTEKLLIPSFPTTRETSESLNVAMATAIVTAEWRRRTS